MIHIIVAVQRDTTDDKSRGVSIANINIVNNNINNRTVNVVNDLHINTTQLNTDCDTVLLNSGDAVDNNNNDNNGDGDNNTGGASSVDGACGDNKTPCTRFINNLLYSICCRPGYKCVLSGHGLVCVPK
jgi:hypothetical protein